eukprot:TRINITY_DN7577_c0_g1_i2.p2 TRINITY_DN7577_c0_g1~~TRINITY_DN7577_c0_g1_i2.p2  ORF type:complete len:191 (-),score=56.30 TRINITY_DN7577_c0_g1_i2:41-613(-)
MEGYSGYGIDLVERKIWKKYPSGVELKEEAIMPDTSQYDVDWILANHSDELTPWVPIIASRQKFRDAEVQDSEGNISTKKVGQRFFVLPCCEWDFDHKFQKKVADSKFQAYLKYIEKIGEYSGFKVESESLRIPSTRNKAILGRYKEIPESEEEAKAWEEKILSQQQQLLDESGYQKFEPKVRKSSSHRG